MLTTDDVLEAVFAPMRTAYGGQWKHGNQAARVWRNSLSSFPRDRIERASVEAMKHYPDHPPTLPQFMALCRPQNRPDTYLPAPSTIRVVAKGNHVLLRVLMCSRGVDTAALRNMVELKNALAEEFLRDNDDKPTPEYVADVEAQLSELARPHDRKARDRESEAARHRKFGAMAGFAE